MKYTMRRALALGVAAATLFQGPAFGEQTNQARSPIKHIIYILGENRSFDNIYATYIPKHGEAVANLLSKGIVNQDGSPGRNFDAGEQRRVVSMGHTYSIAPQLKANFATLPLPTILDAEAVPPAVALGIISSTGVLSPQFPQGDPELALNQQFLLVDGGTGTLPVNGTDTRVANFNALKPGPFPQTGPQLPYDSYEGDTIHQLSQMWQQSDCSMRNATFDNPTGCLHDLYPFVATTYGTPPGTVSTDGSQDMAFYNVLAGDAPILKSLADQYSMSDNFHQAIMGGSVTAAISVAFADNAFFSDGNGNPQTPTTGITDPNPQPGSVNTYNSVGTWIECADNTQPGVKPINDYLASLPYHVGPNCEPGHFYAVRDADPPYNADGSLAAASATTMPPLTMRHIGDALDDKGVSWTWYGGGHNAALAVAQGATDIQDEIFALGYCTECNPFQYAKDVMTTPTGRAHLKDVTDLFNDLKNNTLPAVAFVKPDGELQGHPGSGKVDQFEGFVQNVIDHTKANPALFADTAIVISVDESGGLYDSGFIQPLDFFGDGPRIPLIVVSPFTTGGHVVHTYYDQASVLKFIERNWGLARISNRSRDNLPNPVMAGDNAYVPRNMPAIGDLFDMFNFDQGSNRGGLD
jgi:phospholipase C